MKKFQCMLVVIGLFMACSQTKIAASKNNDEYKRDLEQLKIREENLKKIIATNQELLKKIEAYPHEPSAVVSILNILNVMFAPDAVEKVLKDTHKKTTIWTKFTQEQLNEVKEEIGDLQKKMGNS